MREWTAHQCGELIRIHRPDKLRKNKTPAGFGFPAGALVFFARMNRPRHACVHGVGYVGDEAAGLSNPVKGKEISQIRSQRGKFFLCA
ncbi:hypothetical protein Bxe_A1515 [Paraburkholderia xenovorans LB400]|uniref:Uncharacterized protein n=1 Tax=Paraburkholderia xenovorans (strain LB400) TaxID=266265 RepID=Q13WV0_PARXL|nr:hypothetical protein Bxe_A1515 [Paraburkholderia xenovorans LB400]